MELSFKKISAFLCLIILASCIRSKTDIIIRWALDEELVSIGQELARAYMEEQPGQIIKIIPMPQFTISKKDDFKLFMNQHAVDIYTADTFLLQFLIDNQHIISIRKKLMRTGLSEYFNGFIELCESTSQHVVAFPWLADASALFYRADFFSKAGFSTVRTWNDIESAVKIIKSDNKKVAGLLLPGISGTILSNFFIEALWSQGLDVVTVDGEVMLELPQVILMLKQFKKYLKKRIFAKKLEKYTKSKALKSFTEGNASCFYGKISDWHVINDQYSNSPIINKITFAPIPTADNHSSKSILDPKLLVISTQSKNKAAAISFLNFLISFPSQEIVLMHDWIPALKSIYTDSEAIQYKPGFKKMYSILVPAEPIPLNRIVPKTIKILQKNIRAVFEGKKSPAEAMYSATKSIRYLPRIKSIAHKKPVSTKKTRPHVTDTHVKIISSINVEKSTKTVVPPVPITGLHTPSISEPITGLQNNLKTSTTIPQSGITPDVTFSEPQPITGLQENPNTEKINQLKKKEAP